MLATELSYRQRLTCCCMQHPNHVWGLQAFQGADVRFGDVADTASLSSVAFAEPVDVVVSCLASRTGGKVLALYISPILEMSMHQLCF